MNERLHVALLLAVTMLVYGNTLLNSFTLDDNVYILSNSAVTGPSVRGLFEPDKANHIFRPVTFATFALNWAAGGAQPFGYHLQSAAARGGHIAALPGLTDAPRTLAASSDSCLGGCLVIRCAPHSY